MDLGTGAETRQIGPISELTNPYYYPVLIFVFEKVQKTRFFNFLKNTFLFLLSKKFLIKKNFRKKIKNKKNKKSEQNEKKYRFGNSKNIFEKTFQKNIFMWFFVIFETSFFLISKNIFSKNKNKKM